MSHKLDRYANFWQTVEFVKLFPVLNFDAKADEFYVQILLQNPTLRKKRLRQDLRIAAIALSHNATVATCNHRDFGQVPGLKIVDWLIDPTKYPIAPLKKTIAPPP